MPIESSCSIKAASWRWEVTGTCWQAPAYTPRCTGCSSTLEPLNPNVGAVLVQSNLVWRHAAPLGAHAAVHAVRYGCGIPAARLFAKPGALRPHEPPGGPGGA